MYQRIIRYFKNLAYNPYEDWRVIVLVSGLVTLILLSYSVRMFMQISQGDFFVGGNKKEVRVDTIDRTALKETLDAYTLKKVNFEDLKIHPIHFDDPAI